VERGCVAATSRSSAIRPRAPEFSNVLRLVEDDIAALLIERFFTLSDKSRVR